MSIAEKLQTIAENEQRVYDAGKEAQEQEFWDTYQEKGQRRDYACAFAGWTLENFYPKHNMTPISSYMLFRTFDTRQDVYREVDLVARFAECGVEFDTSKCENFQYMLMNSCVTRIGVVDTRSASTVYQPFSTARLHTIDKLILKDDGSQTFTQPFQGAIALKHIVIEGKIGNTITFAPCVELTTGAEGEFLPDGVTPSNSVQSIIDALVTIEDGVARTVTLHADIQLTDEQKSTIEEKGWDLVQ